MSASTKKPRQPHVGAVMERVLCAARQLAGPGGWAPTDAVAAHVSAGRLKVTPAKVRDAVYWLVRIGVLDRNGPELVRIASRCRP
ncbi:MAG: hypothetical protein NUW01_09555 [Gemmatimonadaceae bacterium]|nr:hypothetical protein [Gemmatimonadaceae bacterium]